MNPDPLDDVRQSSMTRRTIMESERQLTALRVELGQALERFWDAKPHLENRPNLCAARLAQVIDLARQVAIFSDEELARQNGEMR